jgi:hypothetical protein
VPIASRLQQWAEQQGTGSKRQVICEGAVRVHAFYGLVMAPECVCVW